MYKIKAIIGSRWFFAASVALFVIGGVWFSLSARYPMATDEDYHFGLIRLHAETWVPFFTTQPLGANQFGAVVRDPSYIYHYLMSFPYRLISHYTQDVMTQVISLRLLNVALATSALFIFRRLLRYTTLSQPLANLVLACFALTPYANEVAGQINYDNLLWPCVAVVFLLIARIIRSIQNSHGVPLTTLIGLLALCFFGSLIKFPFLPIFIADMLVLAVVIIRHRHGLVVPTMQQWRRTGWWARIVLVGLLVISFGLWTERYGYNLARYHTPVPKCDRVLDVTSCQAYGPWARDYSFQTIFAADRQHWNFAEYNFHWGAHYIETLLYALNGPFSLYGVAWPPPIFNNGLRAILALGVIVLMWQAKRIWQTDATLRWLAVITVCYVAVLWGQNYSDFRVTGQGVAWQGRYLLPVLVVILAWFAKAYALSFNRMAPRLQWVKPMAAVLLLLICLQGGSFITFAVRTDQNWYWDGGIAAPLNDGAKKVLRPWVIGV